MHVHTMLHIPTEESRGDKAWEHKGPLDFTGCWRAKESEPEVNWEGGEGGGTLVGKVRRNSDLIGHRAQRREAEGSAGSSLAFVGRAGKGAGAGSALRPSVPVHLVSRPAAG